MAGLRSYVLARMLWNPKVDANAMIDEYLLGVYGKAAPQMKAYLELLHREVRPGPYGLGAHLWIFTVPDYSDQLLKGGFELMRQAADAADDPAIRRRVEKDRLSLEYYSLLRAREYKTSGGQYAPADLDGLKRDAAAFLARVREHGIKSLHEGYELKFDDAYYANLQAQQAVTLENGAWRAVIVPALNGRAVELTDKGEGRDLLRRVPPGDRAYPDAGGIAVGVYPDMHGKALDVKWSVESSNATELRLKGEAGGLKLARVYRLTPLGLVTRTEALNGSASETAVALQARAEFAPREIDQEQVTFRSTDGEVVGRRLIIPEKEPTGRETWDGPKLPAGEWRLNHAGAVNAFSGAERAVLTWSAKSRPQVVLMLWSGDKKLKPGESVALESTYGR
ncbi:MAG: DUF4838 domain-containing protein [Acidobacteria bacterium]|nr:DUF4838 domain-containing protein [Acidobacteriota bacterium]